MSDLDLDKLLQEIKEAQEREGLEVTPIKRERGVSRQIQSFIQEKEIKAGEHKIPNYLIYQTYLDYKPHTPKESKVEFFRQFGKLFTSKRTAKYRSYLLDPQSFNFTPEGLSEAKEKDDLRKERKSFEKNR